MDLLRLSLIIPIFNRPREIDDLLESLCRQTVKDFEVIIVEDGSTLKCDSEVEKYLSVLNIRYFYKENSGPGQSRNYGSEKAAGNYLVFLDSDCVLPPQYIEAVQNRLNSSFTDAFGGPDKAAENFTTLQKAINYAMTSFFTTGGIRGGSEKLDRFYPRSFNMGYSKAVFEVTGGFSKMRFGEDIDMSIRILNAGFKTALIKEAYVYHKRRTSLRQFYKQVYNSGIARINLYKRHPGSLKKVHTLPALFVIGCIFMLVLAVFVSVYFLVPLVLYTLLLIFNSAVQNKNFSVGMLSAVTSYIQLFGYGIGFLTAFWKRIVLSKGEFAAFTDNFYE